MWHRIGNLKVKYYLTFIDSKYMHACMASLYRYTYVHRRGGGRAGR